MRLTRLVLVASLAAAFGGTAHAAPPDPDDYVTVEVHEPPVCVTEPCDWQPMVEVCVVPLGLCYVH